MKLKLVYILFTGCLLFILVAGCIKKPLDSDPTGIWLTIPRAELEQLGQTETFAERLVHDFPLSADRKVQAILEALPETRAEDRSVLEITPQPSESLPT